MEKDLNLIQFMWNKGIYSLSKMVELVETGEITYEEFHQITRKNYNGVKENGKVE